MTWNSLQLVLGHGKPTLQGEHIQLPSFFVQHHPTWSPGLRTEADLTNILPIHVEDAKPVVPAVSHNHIAHSVHNQPSRVRQLART